MQRKRPPVRRQLRGADGRLEAVLDVLNSDTRSGIQLREVVELWRASGPNTFRLRERHWDLWEEIERVWQNTTRIWPTNTGAARLETIRGNIGADADLQVYGSGAVRTKAVVLFITLLVSPIWHKLAGPCPRCGDYYLKKRASQTVYCSRQCGNAATAAKRTREKFEAARNKKLNRLRAAAAAWNPARSDGMDWRRWIAQRAKVDLRFVASAIRNQEIQKPRGE